MDKIGLVEIILNGQLLIISSSEDLEPSNILTVFHKIEDPILKENGLEDPVFYPKGKIKVINKYSVGKYLAEPFRDIKERTKTITIPSPWMKNLTSAMTGFASETKEITEEVPGKWSADLNKDQSLNIQISKIVSVGDIVGRIK